SINKKVPRIAVGLNNKNELFIFVASKEHAMTLKELAEYMKSKEIISALNLDGGGSVSLNYKNIDIFSDKENTRRELKSFLVVKKY
ncbi:phosphodiester glycosidase family protein, partial [bacterium]|nr:phosphodiester glycosidase family protein [bacterium]